MQVITYDLGMDTTVFLVSNTVPVRPRLPQMAHMNRMVMVHDWRMREEPNSKRAREKISNKAPREPMDAMCQMSLNGFRSFSILVRGREVDV